MIRPSVAWAMNQLASHFVLFWWASDMCVASLENKTHWLSERFAICAMMRSLLIRKIQYIIVLWWSGGFWGPIVAERRQSWPAVSLIVVVIPVWLCGVSEVEKECHIWWQFRSRHNSASCYIKPYLNCNYTFPIDLRPNRIQFFPIKSEKCN